MSERFLSPRVTAVPPSGIRRFFDIAGTMKGAISRSHATAASG